MLSTERPQFEAELTILLSGFPTFITAPRIEAYWRGLQKMQLDTFKRCVIEALSESGPEKMPTVNALWQISRRLRAPAFQPQKQAAPNVGDDFLLLGNRWLLAFLLKTGGVPDEAMLWLIELKNRIVDSYRNSGDECGGPQTAEWMDMAMGAFTACADRRAALMGGK